jgi:hypothetical protein
VLTGAQQKVPIAIHICIVEGPQKLNRSPYPERVATVRISVRASLIAVYLSIN